MLCQLHIKNIGIIDEVTINFEDGLNILTGETGAGKSLIIDSISAITGARMSKEMIKHGEKMALVEACFFKEEEEKILSREFYQNGRSICKIDGRMVTLSELKAVGEKLIDIHGQHDNQSLLDEKTHISLLDGFASTFDKSFLDMKLKYKKEFEEYQRIKEKIKLNFGSETERARRIDLLNYQKEEIEGAYLKEGEEEELESKRNIIMNSEKIVRSLGKSYSLLDEVILDNLEIVAHELSSISHVNYQYDELLKTVNDAYYSLKEVSSDVSCYLEDVSFSEEEQATVENRLDVISSLKRKYGNDIPRILEYFQKISEELDFLENSEEIIKKWEEDLKQKEKVLNQLAEKISNIRKSASKMIEEKVKKELEDLEMKHAYILFDFKETSSYTECGKDKVEILICTNLGEAPKPLHKIASGGEISRIMLALKAILCMYDEIGTMIFDEIDTGISGQAGIAVAEKMKLIGKTHQVICVTHLPVIAAAGDANFFIEKETQNGRTYTEVIRIDEEETIKEIARILNGNDITNAVLAHAKEMRASMK